MDTIDLKTGQTLPVHWAKGPCAAESDNEIIFTVRLQDGARQGFDLIGRTVGQAHVTIRAVDGEATDKYIVRVTAPEEAPEEAPDDSEDDADADA